MPLFHAFSPRQEARPEREGPDGCWAGDSPAVVVWVVGSQGADALQPIHTEVVSGAAATTRGVHRITYPSTA